MAKALAIQLGELQNGKNDKAVIQDANDFYNWAKDDESAIKFYFITSTDYKNAANFLTNAFENIKFAAGTMKLYPVLPHGPNKIWVFIAAASMIIPFNPNQVTLAKFGA